MANWDDHYITIVGPMADIKRFAKQFKIVSGAVDLMTGKVLDGWDSEPAIDLGPGRYVVEKCRVGVCEIQIEFESNGLVWPIALYRALVAHPTLHFIWRYFLDMGWGCGYIDAAGDHRVHEESEDHWVTEKVTKGIGTCATRRETRQLWLWENDLYEHDEPERDCSPSTGVEPPEENEYEVFQEDDHVSPGPHDATAQSFAIIPREKPEDPLMIFLDANDGYQASVPAQYLVRWVDLPEGDYESRVTENGKAWFYVNEEDRVDTVYSCFKQDGVLYINVDVGNECFTKRRTAVDAANLKAFLVANGCKQKEK